MVKLNGGGKIKKATPAALLKKCFDEIDREKNEGFVVEEFLYLFYNKLFGANIAFFLYLEGINAWCYIQIKVFC
jgi:hypothetical protein